MEGGGHLLNEYHDNIDDSDVVNCPGDVLGFIEQRFGVAYIVAHLDAPQKKEKFTFGKSKQGFSSSVSSLKGTESYL